MLSLTQHQCSASCIHRQGLLAARGVRHQHHCLTPGCREAQSGEPTALHADCQIAQATARRIHKMRGSVVHRTHEQALQLLAGLGGSITMLCSQVPLHSREYVLPARTLRCCIIKAGRDVSIVLTHIAIGCCHSIQRQRALPTGVPCERLASTQDRRSLLKTVSTLGCSLHSRRLSPRGALAVASLAGDNSAWDGPMHCTQACSTHEQDLPAGSKGRQGQRPPAGLLHAAAGRPS